MAEKIKSYIERCYQDSKSINFLGVTNYNNMTFREQKLYQQACPMMWVANDNVIIILVILSHDDLQQNEEMPLASTLMVVWMSSTKR